MLATLREVCKTAGIDIEAIGYHSLRIGGTSAIAESGAVPDRLTMQHGRWRTVQVFQGYARSQLQEKLLPSRNVGLGVEAAGAATADNPSGT
jgi:hypothetical protein